MQKNILSIVLLLCCLLCYGQNKAEKYMSNPTEALQDAHASYSAGDYEKAINLIKIFTSLSGKNDGNDILTRAQQCQQYVEKAKLFEEQGDRNSAAQCYNSILTINPNDKNAKSKAETVIFDEVRDYKLGVACVRIGDKWGAIDERKNIIIPVVYDGIYDFWPFNSKQTTTAAYKGGRMGFVNRAGKEVTPFIYSGIRGIELDTPNIYFMVYKEDGPEVYVDMNGVEYPTENEAAYGILGLKKNGAKTTGPYKIGDFYNEKGYKGVVFEIDESGYHGKIVSLMQDYKDWALEDSRYRTIRLGLNDEFDGESNSEIIKKINNWHTLFPAFDWCSQLGKGWYLPAKYELSSINGQITLINKGLRYAGYRPMNLGNYMSSTEVQGESDKIYYMWGLGGRPGEFQTTDKGGCWVVAVKKF